MTTTAASVAQRIVGLTQDTSSIRWPANELVRFINDGQREIIKARPDALNITATGTLAAGTRQDLDAIFTVAPLPLKLIEITRNMAATSTKRAVRQCQRNILDAQIPGWHNLTQSVNVVHFTHDIRDPKTFYVYPPSTALAQLEIMYAAYPTDVTEPADGATYADIAGNISVADIYAADLVDYVLYRCYEKDASYAGNAARSAKHYAAFAQSLGVELNATAQVSPTVKDGTTTGG